MNVPVLETPRLILREVRESDLDRCAAMTSDPDIMRYLSGGKTLTRDETWRNMAMLAGHWQLRGYGYWSVIEKDSGFYVGRVGLWYPEGWPGREVGWTITKDRWRCGYAVEAAEAAVTHAFETLGWEEIISVIHVDNIASQAVAAKLGERRLREIEIMGFPCAIHGMTRAERRARRA